MNRLYDDKYELLVKNFNALTRAFKLEMDYSKHLIALKWTQKNLIIDIDRIKAVKEYIKDHSKLFSPFRGQMQLLIAGMLSIEETSTEVLFDQLTACYETLKSAGFKDTMYLPAAALAFVLTDSGTDPYMRAERAVDMYRQMKSNHPLLTGGDDYALAIALSDANISIDKVEYYYDSLNGNGFKKSNGLQALSHVLALYEGSTDEMIRRCIHIKEQLKSMRFKVGNEYNSVIGLLAIMGDDYALEDVVELAKKIKSTSGYKLLGKDMHIMLASSLISSDLIDNDASVVNDMAVNAIVNAIYMAQQVAMISTMMVTTTVVMTSN